jgi:penicillin-binding protein 1C
LVEATICRRDGRLADGNCESTTEWFVPGTLPPPTKPTTATMPAQAQAQALALADTADASTKPYRLVQPTAGLIVAHDPRIPSEFEALPMRVAQVPGMRRVDWYVDGKREASTNDDRYAWPLVSGTHEVYGQIWDTGSATAHTTEVIRFHVR